MTGTKRRRIQLAFQIPKILLGGGDKTMQNVFWGTFWESLFQQLQSNFDAISMGDVGLDGQRWKPLQPRTLTSRIPRADGGKGLLTADQAKLWQGVFRSRIASFRKSGHANPAAAAAAAAWGVVKARGGKTLLEAAARTKVKMLVRSGKLRSAFSPGKSSQGGYSPGSPFQKASVRPGRITISINVPYAKQQHQLRPLLPQNLEPFLETAVARGMLAVQNWINDQ